MCLDEFIEIFKLSDLLGETLVEKDLNQSFNLSMMVFWLY